MILVNFLNWFKIQYIKYHKTKLINAKLRKNKVGIKHLTK